MEPQIGCPILSTETPAIRLEHVTKIFDTGADAAVGALSLEISEGEIVALIGPSGCGKTTTLRMINRLIEATDGTIEIAGQDIAQQPVAELRRGIGYVIQQVGLFPHWSIAQNIATVPKTLGWDKKRTSERVQELAELVGLPAETLDRYPNELSGGQQQRVGVARALAADPPLLLMDEPFGAVDPIVRAHLQDELLGLQERMQKTIVFVTHDIDEAVKIADRVALLNVGGVLEQLASPDELLRNPSNEFVEAFIGEDRSLKRLALATVGDLAFNQGPVVDLTASAAEAEKVMADCGSTWFGVTSGNAFLGWIEGVSLEAGQPISNLTTQLPAAQVAPASTLRSAMELIMTSNTPMAVVNDNGVFGGVVTLEQIRRGLSAHEAL